MQRKKPCENYLWEVWTFLTCWTLSLMSASAGNVQNFVESSPLGSIMLFFPPFHVRQVSQITGSNTAQCMGIVAMYRQSGLMNSSAICFWLYRELGGWFWNLLHLSLLVSQCHPFCLLGLEALHTTLLQLSVTRSLMKCWSQLRLLLSTIII